MVPPKNIDPIAGAAQGEPGAARSSCDIAEILSSLSAHLVRLDELGERMAAIHLSHCIDELTNSQI